MRPRNDEVSLWLTTLYWYTIVGAGAAGLLVLLAPTTFVTAFGLPLQDPFVLGVTGSLFVGSGAAAAVGVRAPRRFAPIFLVQCGYKTAWLLAVFLPRLLRADVLPLYAWLFAAAFASYVVLDIVVIRSEGLLRPRREDRRTMPGRAATL